MKIDNKRMLWSMLIAMMSSMALNLSLRVLTNREINENMNIDGAHSFYRALWDLKMSFSGYTIQSIIVWVALCVVVYLVLLREEKLYIPELVLAAIFSFFQVFGNSYKSDASWDYIFATSRNMLKAMIAGVGYIMLFYIAIRALLLLLERFQFIKEDGAVWSWFTNNRRSVFAVAGIILLLWLPYLIAYFPGLTNYDFFDMLDSFYGNDTNSIRVTIRLDPNVTLNNNNPVLQTLWGVFIMKIGTALGSPYIGLFLFVAIQTVCYAFVLSYMLYYLSYRGVNRKLRILLLCIFGLVPVHANYAFTTLKDTNFSFVMLLYIICLTELLTNTEQFIKSKKNFWLLGIWALLLLFLRNNGLYAVLFTSIAFIIVMRKYWKKLIAPLFAPIVIYFLVTNCLYPALSISPGNAVAAYSIPVQQLARLATEEPDAIEAGDREIINKVFDYEAFANRYNPELADPVMSSYQKDRTDEEWSDFMGVWVKYLKKYPSVFVQATMNGAYGYFYPSAYNWITYSEITPPAEAYGMKPLEQMEPFHTEAVKIIYILGSIPVVGMLASIGFYTWILFFMVIYMIRKKCKVNIIVLVPLLTILLTAIASPANTMFRYVYPIIVCAPVLFTLLGTMGGTEK